MKSREAEQVHPDVVVLVVGSRLVHRAVRILERVVAHGPVGPVGLAEERPLPVARLAQQVIPGDGLVVFRTEEFVVRHVGTDAVVNRGDQPLVVEEPDGRRKEGLRNAEGHVHLHGGTPLPDDVAVLHHDPAERASHGRGSDPAPEGFLSKCQFMVERQVARRRRLGGDRELHRLLEERRIEAGLLGGLRPPVVPLGKVRVLRGGERCRQQPDDRQAGERDRFGSESHGFRLLGWFPRWGSGGPLSSRSWIASRRTSHATPFR